MTRFTYGLEFEVESISPNRAADVLNSHGIDCDRIDSSIHETNDLWKAVYDGSLNNGAEIVSPILNDSRLNEASTVTRLLAGAGAKVGRSTGFHVHIGFRAFEDATSGESAADVLSRFILNYYAAHHAVASLVAPSRLRNRFCQILNQQNANIEAEWVRGGNLSSRLGSRYYSLNLESLNRHGTVEIRLHQGTLNGVKAIAWAQFIASMIEASKRGDDFTAIDGLNAWAPVERGSGTKDIEACRTLLSHLVSVGTLKPATGDWLANRAARLNG